MYGEYNSEAEDVPDNVIHITKGYSKDHAPELNQEVAQMISVNKTSLPIWIEALSGNSNDKKTFKETVQACGKQFSREQMPYMVADTAFYTASTIASCGQEIRWISRVPETIKEVKQLYHSIDREKMSPAGGGYWYSPEESNYAYVFQTFKSLKCTRTRTSVLNGVSGFLRISFFMQTRSI